MLRVLGLRSLAALSLSAARPGAHCVRRESGQTAGSGAHSVPPGVHSVRGESGQTTGSGAHCIRPGAHCVPLGARCVRPGVHSVRGESGHSAGTRAYSVRPGAHSVRRESGQTAGTGAQCVRGESDDSAGTGAHSVRAESGLTAGTGAHSVRAGVRCVRTESRHTAGPRAALSRGLKAPGGGRRTLCSGPDSRRDLSGVTVVGSADPLTWLRCRFIILLVQLYFEVDLASEEFQTGAKQALVQISHLMSQGRFHRLKGLVSDEMMEYVEDKTRALSKAQMEKLLVTTEDIIFLLPEDIDVVFDARGRKFCSIVMRFWFLTTLEGPEDPEATRIFKVAPREDGRPQERVATAVYEFKRELTSGACPDWTVITVWHWHWTLAPKTPKAPD